MNKTEIFLPLFFHLFDELVVSFGVWSCRYPFSQSRYLITPILLLYQLSSIPTLLPFTSLLKFFVSTFDLFCPMPPIWFTFLKILLSNDIEKNPGDFRENFFSFCNWNINSLAKDNFQRVQLLEAHNSIFSYDIISLTEVSINDTVEVPDTLRDDYTFVHKSNNANTRHGGVGLLYRNSLPCSVRHDLGFDEALVVELNFKKRKFSLQCYIGVPQMQVDPPNLNPS